MEKKEYKKGTLGYCIEHYFNEKLNSFALIEEPLISLFHRYVKLTIDMWIHNYGGVLVLR